MFGSHSFHVPQPAPADSQAPIKITNPTGPRELIMVVDDMDLIVRLTERVLTLEGYRAVSARDGRQALDIFSRMHDQISLVLLDFVLPGMDGSAVFDGMSVIDSQIPVVLTSGLADEQRFEAMLAKGVRGFVPKPHVHNRLLGHIRTTLDTVKSEASS